MEISGVCERCGRDCNIVYAKAPQRFTEPEGLRRTDTVITITVTCPNCGQYRRPSFTQPERDDTIVKSPAKPNSSAQ